MQNLLRFLGVIVLAIAAHSSGFRSASAADETPSTTKYRLEESRRTEDLTRVQSIFEVSGQLKVNADGKQLIRLPLSGKGQFEYSERWLSDGTSSAPRRTMRYYHSTTATTQIGEKKIASQLSDDRRLIAVQATASEVTLFSPLGPLTRDELELIDIQGSTLLLGRLLSGRETALSEKWKHDDELVAALLNLDVVTENTLATTFQRLEGKTALLEMSGKVQGSVGGISTSLDVSAKYHFDLESKRVSWLTMSIKEDRAIGHAEPGFDVTARLQMTINKGDRPPELSDEAIAQLPSEPSAGTTLLSFSSDAGGVRFVHDRDWRVMVDRNDVIILRLIQRGDLIAQCNLSRLPDAADGKQLTMSSFQADIRRVLDKSFGQFVEANESKNDHELRVLRTIVSGVASELPIQWNYYHLTAANGYQASLVFTMDAKLMERFGAADHTIISSLELAEKHSDPVNSSNAKTAVQPSGNASKPTQR